MLYLVATPIGNLADITYRAVETLKRCDYILCEDTRHSGILLSHYQIHKELVSYHKFNEAFRKDQVIRDLTDGKQIALISDAGTPGISDPGAELAALCILNSISVTAIPGPCAAIQALSCSGFDTDRFQFIGFLARKEGELRHILQQILPYDGTSVCYESPHRILFVLQLIKEIDPERQLVIARELTKKFEEIVRGTANELLARWENSPVKGEIVLVISKNLQKKDNDWEKLSPRVHVEFLQETYSIGRNDAIKIAAELRGVPKRQIYNLLQKKDGI